MPALYHCQQTSIAVTASIFLPACHCAMKSKHTKGQNLRKGGGGGNQRIDGKVRD